MKLMHVFWISLCFMLANGQVYDRLFNELLAGYNKYTLPVRSKNDTVIASLSISLLQVNSLSTETGDIELDAWLFFTWNDFRLQWNPEDFDGITTLRIPSSKLWSPDIVLYNGHTDNEKDFNAVVSHDGGVTDVPPIAIKSRCDVTRYYHDRTVACALKFGSWTYDGSLIDLTLKANPVDLSNYSQGQWEIINGTARRNVVHYACCPEPYVDLTYTLVFRDKLARKSWSFFD